MLSEAFLSTILYEKVLDGDFRQDKPREESISLKCSPHNVHCAEEGHSCRVNPTGGGANGCGEEGHRHGQSSATSEAMTIPSRDQATSSSLDLYTSWSSMYATIYKNYPDLHIGGDHILNKKDSGCVLECEDGPVLLSVDIDSGSLPNDLLEGPSEEGVLHSGDSNVLPCAPFSNSILNGFLEKKMQELYKQFYEETLVTNGSLNPRWPNILMVNFNQMSLLVSQEQNIDQAKAKEAILQYLCSAGGSSEFVTPVLHISNQDSKKRASPFSEKLRL